MKVRLGHCPVVLGVILIFASSAARAADLTRTVLHWERRPYIVHIPAGIGSTPAAVMLTFHGGSGNNQSMNRVTCPNGDTSDPECLNAISDREGFVAVYPNGTADPAKCQQDPAQCNVRSWNGGGGTYGYACSGAYACDSDVDDLAYLSALLADLAHLVTIDSSRIFAAGISNGAAMAERLACQWSEKIAAIADIAGANQFSTSALCRPARPVPFLSIHGTTDPVWPYLGGTSSLQPQGIYFSAKQTALDWTVRNGCAPGSGQISWLPPIPGDPTRAGVTTFSGCAAGADVIHCFVVNGGHTWPGGWQYLPSSIVGLVSQTFSANEVVWGFFKAHPL